MTSKSERRAAREAVAAHHEAVLVEQVGSAVDRFRRGELNAFGADQALSQYARAAKDLWKFCSLGDPELVAGLIRDGQPVDWWERGHPRQR